MGIQNQALQSLNNVKSFRGLAVVGGAVQVSDDDVVKHLDQSYGDAVVCNVSFTPGDVLRQMSPTLFKVMKDDYHQECQNSLMGQLSQGNDVDIEFHD